jgi:hypothetical protein
MVELYRQAKTPDSSTRVLGQSYQKSHRETKQDELAKELTIFCLTTYLFHSSQGSLTCRKILRHGADGFTTAHAPTTFTVDASYLAYSSEIDTTF